MWLLCLTKGNPVGPGLGRWMMRKILNVSLQVHSKPSGGWSRLTVRVPKGLHLCFYSMWTFLPLISHPTHGKRYWIDLETMLQASVSTFNWFTSLFLTRLPFITTLRAQVIKKPPPGSHSTSDAGSCISQTLLAERSITMWHHVTALVWGEEIYQQHKEPWTPQLLDRDQTANYNKLCLGDDGCQTNTPLFLSIGCAAFV